jgi:hypothetical protein
VKGRIVDSAFTLNFEPTYDTLIEAVKAATDTGVRVSPVQLYMFDCSSQECVGIRYRCAFG